MLNMLIAIMSDTFEKVTEIRKVHSRRTKLEILADYVDCYNYGRNLKQSKAFMFVVKPEEEDLDRDSSEWEGTLTTLRKFTD